MSSMSQPRARFRDLYIFFSVACRNHEAVSIKLFSRTCYVTILQSFKVENVYINDMALNEKDYIFINLSMQYVIDLIDHFRHFNLE